MPLSTSAIRRMIHPFQPNNMQCSTLQILRDWTVTEPGKPNEAPVKFLCYEMETIDPETGEKFHFYKAIKFMRLIRIPKGAKESVKLMDMQTQILSAAYEQDYKFITVIANMRKPPIGLVYLYGVQGVGHSIDEAMRIATGDFNGLKSIIQGTYRVMEACAINEQEMEWLHDKLYSMDHGFVLRGIPKASHSGEDAGNKGMGGKNLNPDSEGTIEEMITGMVDHEYIIEVLTTPVPQSTLRDMSAKNAMMMTEWHEKKQGTKGFSMNLSIPMMYAANQGTSQGVNRGYTTAESVNTTQGTSLNTSYGENVGQALSESYGQSFGKAYGQSFSESISQTHSVSQGMTVGHSYNVSIGQSQGQSFGQSLSNSESQSVGQSQSVSEGQSFGQSYGQNSGQSVGQNFGQSVGQNYGQSIGQNQGQSFGQNIGHSESTSIGQSLGRSIGQNTSQSMGTSMGKSFGESYNQGVSHNRSISEGRSFGESFGQSSTLGESFGTSQNISRGTSQNTSFGQSVGDSYGVSNGQSMSRSEGSSASTSHSVGTSDSVSTGESASKGYSYGESNGTSHSNGQSGSSGWSESESLGRSSNISGGKSWGFSEGTNASSGTSVNFSSNNSDSSSNGSGGSLGISPFGIGVNGSTNSSTGHSTGFSSGYGGSSSSGSSVGYNEGGSISESTGKSYSAGHGESGSFGLSESVGTSTSMSSTMSESTGLSSSRSQGVSESYGNSYGQSMSESYGVNQSTSESHSASNSMSQGFGQSYSEGQGMSSSMSQSQGTSYGQNIGQSYSQSDGMGMSEGYGRSVGENYGQSMSESYGQSSSESYSQSSSQGIGTSYGESTGQSYGTSYGQSMGQSFGQTTGQSVGQTQGQSYGENVGQTQGTSYGNTLGQSVGISKGTTQSMNVGTSKSVSEGTSVSESYSESWATSHGYTKGESLTESTSESASHGTTLSQGQSKSIGQGQSTSVGRGTSESLSQAISSGLSRGTSASMGIAPSIGYSKSYQWVDQMAVDIIEMLEYQNERLKNALRGNGAFYTYVYIATDTEEAYDSARALAKSTWQNEEAMMNPLQVRTLNRDEEESILTHCMAFSADVSMERCVTSEYSSSHWKYQTILLPKELVSYTHPPRVSEGGLYVEVGDVPKFSTPSMMKGEIFIGNVLNAERYSWDRGYMTDFQYRFDESELMHAIICGQSRSGKTVLGMRLIAQLAHVRRKKTGKRLRIVCMDPKQDWRGLANYVQPERFNYYNMASTQFHSLKLNPLKIPRGVLPQVWCDSVVDDFARAYGLLERGKQMIGETIYELYQEAGVFGYTEEQRQRLSMEYVEEYKDMHGISSNDSDGIRAANEYAQERIERENDAIEKNIDHETINRLSGEVTFAAVYERMNLIKLSQEGDKEAEEEYVRKTHQKPKGKSGNDTKDAYARLLDRLQAFNRKFSIERQLFGTSEGISIDELIGADDVTVLESKGLENTFRNFIFGVITSGFYKYALAHEGGYLAENQYETVLVIEEANEVLTGSDIAGTGSGQSFGMTGISDFEAMLAEAAGYGLFCFAITQTPAAMPKAIIANAGLKFVGRMTTPDDITTAVRSIAREDKFEDRDLVKWLPRSPTGWFICMSSRTFDFKDAEPVLVKVAQLNKESPNNAELNEILAEREFMRLNREEYDVV